MTVVSCDTYDRKMYLTAKMFSASIGRLFWAIPIALCVSMQPIAPASAQAIRPDALQAEIASDPRPMALFVTGPLGDT